MAAISSAAAFSRPILSASWWSTCVATEMREERGEGERGEGRGWEREEEGGGGRGA